MGLHATKILFVVPPTISMGMLPFGPFHILRSHTVPPVNPALHVVSTAPVAAFSLTKACD